MNEIVIDGYRYSDVDQAAAAYKAAVDKCEPEDAAQRGEIEVEIHDSIREYHDDVPQAEFDAYWTQIENALNRI